MNSISFILFTLFLSSLLFFSATTFLVLAQAAECEVKITKTGSKQNLSIDVINLILKKHNDARRGLSPIPETMPVLTWNDKLADGAYEYLKKCGPAGQHSSQTDRSNFAGFSYVGENLGAGQGTKAVDHFYYFVDLWMAEKQWYTYAPEPCATEKANKKICGQCQTGNDPASGLPIMCGHWTQVIDSRATQVGAASIDASVCGDAYTRYAAWYGSGGNQIGTSPYKQAASGATYPPCATSTPSTIIGGSSSGNGGTTNSPSGGNNNNNNNSPNGTSPDDGGSGSNAGAIAAGVVVPIVVIAAGVAGFLWWKKNKAGGSSSTASEGNERTSTTIKYEDQVNNDELMRHLKLHESETEQL